MGENYGYEEYENPRIDIIIGIVLFVMIFSVVIVGFSIGKSFISTYNDLIDMEEDVKLAQANVQTMIQRRLELIPDLVKVVQAYSDHEEKVFEDIANALAALSDCLDGGTPKEISEANSNLSERINQLLVIAEEYPDLTAGEQYISLMDQLEGSINRISIAREDYNEEVSEYNKMVRKLPGSILAKIFDFQEIEYFEADKAAEETSLVHFNKE